ncbi:hypothetical protein KCM76_22500 [Zooshikella marina]|uniref:hypothetical protein n=1 Tax=Zooshikella ganghwensis TaxID=202772 RepID=UPI001BAFE34D|nr:hypothetical protein [Zooshikella ganghwensis]MBU2708781.1 hypothetical protein [Zooshikella ganghwensis]
MLVSSISFEPYFYCLFKMFWLTGFFSFLTIITSGFDKNTRSKTIFKMYMKAENRNFFAFLDYRHISPIKFYSLSSLWFLCIFYFVIIDAYIHTTALYINSFGEPQIIQGDITNNWKIGSRSVKFEVDGKIISAGPGSSSCLTDASTINDQLDIGKRVLVEYVDRWSSWDSNTGPCYLQMKLYN